MENSSEMTAERSLEIIRKTLEQSRKDVTRASGGILLLWGALVTVTAVIIYFLWSGTGRPAWNLLWFAMTIIGMVIQWVWNRKEELPTKTFLTDVLGYIWSAFGIFAVGFSVLELVCLAYGSAHPGFVILAPQMTPVIVLLLGLAGTITGWVLDNKWLAIGSIAAGLGGAFTAMLLLGPAQMLVIAAVAVAVLVIPAAVIKSKKCSSH